MATKNTPRLCGGTFFLQILRMKKKKIRKQSELLNGKTEPLSNQRVLEALIRIFNPDFAVYSDNTFKGDVSDYRACKESCGDNLPFDESHTDFSHFDNVIKNDYNRVLPEMNRFVDLFIAPDKMYQTVKAILGCIKDDETTDDAVFYMGEMGSPISKTDLLNADEIILEPFLLGLWHFILLNRPNNLIGRDTFEEWNTPPSAQGQRWKYVSTIGADYHEINIRRWNADTVFEEINGEDTEPEELYEDTEEYESEVIDDPEFIKYKESFYQPVIINNWYNAPNGIQVQHIESLTLNITRK